MIDGSMKNLKFVILCYKEFPEFSSMMIYGGQARVSSPASSLAPQQIARVCQSLLLLAILGKSRYIS